MSEFCHLVLAGQMIHFQLKFCLICFLQSFSVQSVVCNICDTKEESRDGRRKGASQRGQGSWRRTSGKEDKEEHSLVVQGDRNVTMRNVLCMIMKKHMKKMGRRDCSARKELAPGKVKCTCGMTKILAKTKGCTWSSADIGKCLISPFFV